MRDFRTALLAATMVFGLASAASAGPGAVDWTGVFISGQIGGGGDVNKVLQNFNPVTPGTNAVGSINPLADPYAPTSFAPTATPPGYQSLTSTTYSSGANYSVLQAGGGNLINSQNITYPVAPTSLGEKRLFGSGGLEFGYMKQFNRLVVGVAADFNWLTKSNGDGSWTSSGGYSDFVQANGTNVRCSNTFFQECSVVGTSTASGSVQATANWLGTVRAKIGITSDRLLGFVTGGLAYGQVRLSSSANWADTNVYSNAGCGSGPPCTGAGLTNGVTGAWSGSTTQTKTGWALGGGFNYALTDNFYIKTEGIYYDLGKSSLTVNGTGVATCVATGGFAGACGPSPANTPVASYTVERRFNGVIASVGAGIKF
ncbi:MAG: porin [Pseudolabrys sp.]